MYPETEKIFLRYFSYIFILESKLNKLKSTFILIILLARVGWRVSLGSVSFNLKFCRRCRFILLTLSFSPSQSQTSDYYYYYYKVLQTLSLYLAYSFFLTEPKPNIRLLLLLLQSFADIVALSCLLFLSHRAKAKHPTHSTILINNRRKAKGG
jgi:hypothetical protein